MTVTSSSSFLWNLISNSSLCLTALLLLHNFKSVTWLINGLVEHVMPDGTLPERIGHLQFSNEDVACFLFFFFRVRKNETPQI